MLWVIDAPGSRSQGDQPRYRGSLSQVFQIEETVREGAT